MTINREYLINLFRKDETIKITTVSPNGKYFFKIKEPKDLYWGLLCCPIAFFDIEGNLIYFKHDQYAECYPKNDEEWNIVKWSKKGEIAFFIERNSTKSFQYVLINLENRTISKTNYCDKEEQIWIDFLFKLLPEDEARKVHFEIISASNLDKAIEYVEELKLLEGKRELKEKLTQYYFSDFNLLIKQLHEDSFNEEELLQNRLFENFIPITTDFLPKGLLEFLGINKWRP